MTMQSGGCFHKYFVSRVNGWKNVLPINTICTHKNMWVPAVNNSDEFGEWTFLEITDPWDMQNTIREFMSEYAS